MANVKNNFLKIKKYYFNTLVESIKNNQVESIKNNSNLISKHNC